MVLDNIKNLIEKYENGETSLKEESLLKDYFSQDIIDPEFEVYKPLFQYFSITKQEQFTNDIPLKTKNKFALYRWLSVAAVAVLMLGLYFQNTSSNEDIDPILAQQTMEALTLLSSNFNKGTSNIDLLSSNFNKGAQNLAYVGTFGETKNKIFKNK